MLLLSIHKIIQGKTIMIMVMDLILEVTFIVEQNQRLA